eukprot:166752-Prorocentrum_minimum.AAC.2
MQPLELAEGCQRAHALVAHLSWLQGRMGWLVTWRMGWLVSGRTACQVELLEAEERRRQRREPLVADSRVCHQNQALKRRAAGDAAQPFVPHASVAQIELLEPSQGAHFAHALRRAGSDDPHPLIAHVSRAQVQLRQRREGR